MCKNEPDRYGEELIDRSADRDRRSVYMGQIVWITWTLPYPLVVSDVIKDPSVSHFAVEDMPLSGSSGPPSMWILPRMPFGSSLASFSAA
jgi:hypothetical protein